MADQSRVNDLLQAVDLIAINLDAAHKIAQQHEGDSVADSIHAIIHRREGDYSNSIYWWRRVGEGLETKLADVYPNSDPAGFVRSISSQSLKSEEIEKVQIAELDALRSILGAD